MEVQIKEIFGKVIFSEDGTILTELGQFVIGTTFPHIEYHGEVCQVNG